MSAMAVTSSVELTPAIGFKPLRELQAGKRLYRLITNLTSQVAVESSLQLSSKVECLSDIQFESKNKPQLLHYHEIPEWQQNNEYLLSGYRPTCGSVYESFESLSYMHNETVNIYSHLIGALLFLSMPIIFWQYLSSVLAQFDFADCVVFGIYICGVATCFGLSSFAHMLCNCTSKWAAYSTRLDFLGIVTLMWGATIPTVYYGFYDDHVLQQRYWLMTSCLAVVCAVVTMDSRFSQPSLRAYRAGTYAALGFSGLIFTVHGLSLYGWELQNKRMSLQFMMVLALCNCVGAFFYAARIPERWVPYKFDTCGSSHQIFHIMVVIAAIVHLAGLVPALEAAHSS